MAADMNRWEYITGGRDGEPPLYRIAVPGGWLYRTVERGLGVAMAFVPEARPQDQHELRRAV